MLVLGIKTGESMTIRIGSKEMRMKFIKAADGVTRIAIDAPQDFKILRDNAKKREHV